MAKERNVEDDQGRPEGLTAFESKLINLLALQLVQERRQSDQISLLNRAGFQSAEIAALLGTTRNTVSVELSVRKRQMKGGKRKTKK